MKRLVVVLASLLWPALAAADIVCVPKSSCASSFTALGGTVTAPASFTSTVSVIDGNFSIVGSADATKIAKFEVDGFTTANTRVFTIPGTTGNDTFVMLGGAQTITGGKTFGVSFGVSPNLSFSTNGIAGPGITYRTAMTPDAAMLYTDTLANTWHLMELGDVAVDMGNGPAGTVAAINPQFTVHDKDQNTTNYQALGLPGLSGKFVVTLTESSATNIVTIPIASDDASGGTLQGVVFASNGTAQQARSMLLRYTVVNEADTETCSIGTAAGVAATNETNDGNLAAITTGTLTYTWACAAGTNAVTITLNAISSLAQSVLEFRGTLTHTGAGEPLPQ